MTLDEFVAALMDCGANGDAPVYISDYGPAAPVSVTHHDNGRVIIELEDWE